MRAVAMVVVAIEFGLVVVEEDCGLEFTIL